jgi:hypothetical protein
MILRRREKRTLDALENLVVYLRGVRDERKAVLVITNGWRLYGPDDRLARPIDGNLPSLPPITIDPLRPTDDGAGDNDQLRHVRRSVEPVAARRSAALRDIIDRANR